MTHCRFTDSSCYQPGVNASVSGYTCREVTW